MALPRTQRFLALQMVLLACLGSSALGISELFGALRPERREVAAGRCGRVDSRPNVLFILTDDQDAHMGVSERRAGVR